jgi:putative peptidoglycan lipid II flippase
MSADNPTNIPDSIPANAAVKVSGKSSPTLGRQIAGATAIVMASVLLSRLLGFWREWAVAHQVGSNATTDAYYAAFTLPDFLNYLVAAGSLSVTFIPVFSKYMAEKNEEEGWRVFSIVVSFMGLVMIAVVVLAEIFAPKIVSLIAPGFGVVEKEHVVSLTRLMLPAQFCFYMGGILSAVQYAKNRFIVPSLAPLVYNIGVILCGVLLSSRLGITGFAVGVLVGAIVGNFLLQVYGAKRAGAKFFFSLNIRHPGFILFVKLAVPIMLALSLAFTDDWIIRWFGSYLQPASITWLSYAKTLMRVPLGIVGQAIGVASFPVLAQLFSEKRMVELDQILSGTMKGIILMLMPITALTVAMSVPLVHLVFSHTRLHEQDLLATAGTLVWFSLGMIAWGAQNILARAFYAMHDTITPAVVGTAITVLNLPLYWLLVRHMQHLGLAAASSAGITAYTIILFVILIRKTSGSGMRGLMSFFARVSIASAIGGIVCWKFVGWLGERISWRTFHGAFIDLSVATVVGVALTILVLHLFGVKEVKTYIKRMFMRFAGVPA